MAKYIGKKPILEGKIWGHCHLIRTERVDNSTGGGSITDQSKWVTYYHYRCDCGNTWTQDAHSRMWHCGALDCPHLPRRKRQAFKPNPPGRPRKYMPVFGKEDVLSSTSTYKKRITFAVIPTVRDEFEAMCSVLHTSMNRELAEMVDMWIENNYNAVNKVVHIKNYEFDHSKKDLVKMTPEQLEEQKEKEELHARRFAVYSKPKSLEEFFAVGQDRWRPKKNDGTEW